MYPCHDRREEEEKALSSGQKIPHPVHGVTSGDPIQPTHNGTANGTASSDTVSEASASGVSIDSTTSTSEASERPTPTPSHRTSSSSLNSNSSAGSGKTTKRRGEAPPPSKTHHRDEGRVTVTFGISAAPDFQPIRNLGGWKVKALSKTYSKVASGAKLINRGDFRVSQICPSLPARLTNIIFLQNKFDSEHDPMYVCYPPDGFGLDGVNALLKLLRK